MKSWEKISVAVVVLALCAGYFFQRNIEEWYRTAERAVTTRVAQLEHLDVTALTPPPLRRPVEEETQETGEESKETDEALPQTQTDLSVIGIVAQTNIQRTQNGLPPLTLHAQLTAAAQAKVDDMFARQYFEHESPTGEEVGDLAKEAGYAYLLVGENLALGDYEGDADLVGAWMDSTGHRENILNPQYEDIGVAIGWGIFEGEETWLAVQEFGRPASDCPSPDETLKTRIETQQEELDDMGEAITDLRDAIEHTKPKQSSEYRELVEQYNELVRQYNELLEDVHVLIAQYNTQIQSFNACLQM